jgi:hypothetical protein
MPRRHSRPSRFRGAGHAQQVVCRSVPSSHTLRYASLASEQNNYEAVAAMKPWSRILLGIAGIGLLLTGCIAVFAQGTNVAGVPLLIVAGAAFLCVSLTGQQLIQLNKDCFVLGRRRLRVRSRTRRECRTRLLGGARSRRRLLRTMPLKVVAVMFCSPSGWRSSPASSRPSLRRSARSMSWMNRFRVA